MKPRGPATARPGSPRELTVRLRLEVREGQRCWQGDVLGSSGPKLHFDSLPDLIGWLARLQWQTSGAPGVR